MNNKHLLYALALCAWLVWFPAQVRAAVPIQIESAADISFWVAQNRQLPMLEVALYFKGAGKVSDPSDKQGRAAVAAQMLMEGAGEYDAQAFHRALEAKAIQLSVQADGDGLSITLTCLTQHRDAAFALLSELLLRPRFEEASLVKVKRQMQVARARQAESAWYLARHAYAQQAFAGHSYAQEYLGSDASVAALSAQDLRDYMQRYLAKDALVLSFAGDISGSEAADLVAEALSALPQQAQPEQQVKEVPALAQPVSLFVAQDLPQTSWLFARSAPSRTDPDFYAAYVLNHLLGGGTISSRLGEEVRKKQGLTYGIGTSLDVTDYAPHWTGWVQTQHATAQQTQDAVKAVLAQVAQQGVSAEELAAAKAYITGSFPLQMDSNAAVAGYLQTMQRYDLGADYLEKRNAYFQAVSLEQVNQMAKTWLSPAQWSWVRVGAPAQVAAENETKAGN